MLSVLPFLLPKVEPGCRYCIFKSIKVLIEIFSNTPGADGGFFLVGCKTYFPVAVIYSERKTENPVQLMLSRLSKQSSRPHAAVA